MGHADFLELVLADEVTRREAKPTGLRARAAGLDAGMRLDAWDASAAVRYDQQLWNELVSLRFLDGPTAPSTSAPPASAKPTWPAPSATIAGRRRRTVHMAPAAKLFKRLKAARLDNTLEAETRRLAGVELLILGDFALQPLDATETADFYQLCAERHQRTSTVVTSNRTAGEWLAMMAAPPRPARREPAYLHRPRTRHRRRVPPPPETIHPPQARHQRVRWRRESRPAMITPDPRWSLPRGNAPVPSRGSGTHIVNVTTLPGCHRP